MFVVEILVKCFICLSEVIDCSLRPSGVASVDNWRANSHIRVFTDLENNIFQKKYEICPSNYRRWLRYCLGLF